MSKITTNETQKNALKQLIQSVKATEEQNKRNSDLANQNVNIYVQAILDGKGVNAEGYDLDEDLNLIKELKDKPKIKN